MSKTKFEHFHNHGDEDGNNSLTVCFGDSDEPDHIIVTCEDTEEDATEVVKRLNEILDEYASQVLSEYKEKLKNGIQKGGLIATGVPQSGESSYQETHSGIPESLIPGANWINPHTEQGAGEDYPVIPEGSEKIRGSQIKATFAHDPGAYGRCSYCGRYSDDLNCLSDLFVCDCGKSKGYSGSFKPPTTSSKWHELAVSPPPQVESQDDLWSELESTCINWSIPELMLEEAKEKFAITRKS